MTKLTHTARTILRSRVRRHPDNASVLAGRKVSELSNADLIQAALLLSLDVPSADECETYDRVKANGGDALFEADGKARTSNRGGAGFARVLMASQGQPASATTDDEAPSVDPEDDADTVQPAAPVRTKSEPVQSKSEDDIRAQAKAKAGDIRQLLGRGDFEGFTREIEELAVKALTPPPAPIVQMIAAIDPSKIKGTVPQVIGRKDMKAAGISCAGKVNLAATALDVYDAPDAPSVDKNYLWPDDTGTVLAYMARGRNVMFWGPAGTGKTTFPKQVAARWGRPFVRISCTEDTEAAMLVGMTVPSKDGGTTWQDGQLTAAIRRPGTVVLVDEPSVARPGALFVLQALLDDDRSIHIAETGEVVRAAPGVIVVLADNTNGTGDNTGAYEGTRRLNRATLDRAAITVPFDYLSPDREAAALVALTGCRPQTAAMLCKFAALTRAKASQGHVSHGIGFRRLVALAEGITFGTDPVRAFQLAVLETAPFDDREPLRQLWTAEVRPANLA